MENTLFIQGKRINLVCFGKEFAGKVHEWLNDMENIVPFEEEPFPSNLSETEEFIENLNKDKTYLLFGIQNRDDSRTIGMVGLRNIEYLNRKADLMISVCEKEYRGRGYGNEAVNLILDYAFRKLNLNNVMLSVYDYNQKALNLYNKCGFRIIGKRRQAKLIDNKYCDLLFMDILAEEFFRKK